MKLIRISNLMIEECKSAMDKFPTFASYHEGKAVIEEELDELWDEIKDKQDKDKLRAEAIQIGAMAIRFVNDLLEVKK